MVEDRQRGVPLEHATGEPRGFSTEKRAADVVEHAVQEDTHPAPAGFDDQPVEALSGTQTAVDGEVVDGVVAVRLGLEDGSQGQP